jgi:hypothetical protein
MSTVARQDKVAIAKFRSLQVCSIHGNIAEDECQSSQKKRTVI